MPDFLFSYRSPQGYTGGPPETVQAWTDWFASMGDHVIAPGVPVFESRTVGGNVPGPTQLGGYSVIRGQDLDAVVALAESCPGLRDGFVIEVGPLAYREDAT